MQYIPTMMPYALAHGSFAGVPEDATNLRTSKPVRFGRGGAILPLNPLAPSKQVLKGAAFAISKHEVADL